MRFLAAFLILIATATAADNLKLNQKLDYNSDSNDGPLIIADNLLDGPIAGKPTYVIMFQRTCFNSKRQARRTVSLYEKYKGRVQFVVIDLDTKHSPEQQKLVDRNYGGYIPHVMVLGKSGEVLYSAAGEMDEEPLSKIIDKALAK